MKKIFKGILVFILTFILIFLLIWFSAIIKHEYLTLRYGHQFKELYKENPMIGEDLFRFKVMEYNDNYASIYYVSGYRDDGTKWGNSLRFKKENGKWIFTGAWSTVWSNRGSADGYIWPYGR